MDLNNSKNAAPNSRCWECGRYLISIHKIKFKYKSERLSSRRHNQEINLCPLCYRELRRLING